MKTCKNETFGGSQTFNVEVEKKICMRSYNLAIMQERI